MKEEEEEEESKRENEKSVFSPSKTHQLRKEVPSQPHPLPPGKMFCTFLQLFHVSVCMCIYMYVAVGMCKDMRLRSHVIIYLLSQSFSEHRAHLLATQASQRALGLSCFHGASVSVPIPSTTSCYIYLFFTKDPN